MCLQLVGLLKGVSDTLLQICYQFKQMYIKRGTKLITNMIVFIRILINILFLTSCQDTNIKDNNQIVTFNLKQLPKITTLKLSDLGFIDIEYIPLETNEQSLISGTNNLITGNEIIVGERFYIVKFLNTILKFQNNGTFATRIGKEGRGPNEFVVAYDVIVNDIDQSIFLLCDRGSKFNIYNERGEFVKTFYTPFCSYEFTFTESGILCYSENHFGNFQTSYNFIDTIGRSIKSFPNKYPFNNHNSYFLWHENLFYRFNNKLFKKEVYSDTIYVFEDMSFKPHLVIDVGEKLLTPNARSEFEGLYLAKNYISPLKLFEFGDYVYYEFVYKFALPEDVLIFSFIGSKKNNFRAIINTGQGIINDLDGGPNILPKTIKDDYTIIALVDALQLKTHVSTEAFKNSKPKYPEKKKELEKLANGLKETDNPVLVSVRLKK